jgi:microcin C transport system substrate-binding protein
MSRTTLRLILTAFALMLGVAAAHGEPRHGFSPFGDLGYPADFSHFAYVDPDAPKGGLLRLSALGTFDSLNPFIVRGLPPISGMGLLYGGLDVTFDSLLVASADEPDSFYGQLAESVDVAADLSSVTFRLRAQARFADGTPVTAADVAATAQALRTKGDPVWRQRLADIGAIESPDPLTVTVIFSGATRRTLPIAVATMPVLAAAWLKDRDFGMPSLDAPLASGPYRVAAVEAGRSITFERRADYWGRDLPVNRGRFNFDRVRFDYYRDREVDFEAFKAGAYDFREEFTSRLWATGYTGPAFDKGLIRRASVGDERPTGIQAFFLNLRRPKFQDMRVRQAIGMAFDFEWSNRALFFGAYKRMASIFENAPLAAHGRPSTAELSLLEMFRGQVPDSVYGEPYFPPLSDGSGELRGRLKAARDLLAQAGWRIVEGRLVNDKGESFEIEFLLDEPSFERVVRPFMANLERLGFVTKYREMDTTGYTVRRQNYDYDVVTQRYGLDPTPTVELRDLWGSGAADSPGSLNLAGIKDPVVDTLIERVIAADTRPEYETAARALDRVVMWNEYIIPQWYKSERNIAWWDRFGRPPLPPRYDLGVLDTWWYDAARAAATDAGKAP